METVYYLYEVINMEQTSMTALVSAFARWYHAEENQIKVFDDFLAGKMLTDEEKQRISGSMSAGIAFFNPAFSGTESEALRWIVDTQLSPSPLGRAAFAEKALQAAVCAGATQYLLIAAGYDTFACRRPAWASKLRIFELDHPKMSEDKRKRLERLPEIAPGDVTYIPIDLTSESLSDKLAACDAYDNCNRSFCSLLGISYYLSKEDFTKLMHSIAELVSPGSIIAFDYPDEYAYTEQAGERAKKQAMMASAAKEAMLASYAYGEIRRLLGDCGFLVCEHLTPTEITDRYFAAYNKANPDHLLAAFDNTNYCLAARK